MSEQIDPELIQKLSEKFDEMCQRRHEMGHDKYGPVKFLEVNALGEAMNEVIDLANYARYTWIKLALLMGWDPSTGHIDNTPVEVDYPTDIKNSNSSTPYNSGFFNPYRRDK